MFRILAVFTAGLLLLNVLPSLPVAAQGNLIGYWKFDEPDAGDTAADSSGRGNDATPLNSPVPAADVPTAMGEAFDDPRSVSFDGSTQYYTAANDGSFDDTGAVSVSVWVKFDTVNTNQTIIGRWHVGKHQQWVLQLNSSNKIAFWTGDGSTGASNLESASTVSAGTWYHVVATATADSKKLYLNGQLSNSGPSGSMGLAAAADVTIGSKLNASDTYFEFLDGSLDDLRVYNRVLSDAEVAELAVGSQTSATWTGSVSSDWNTAGNWSIDAVPDAHTNVTIPDAVTYPVLTQATAAAKVTVSSGGKLDLNGFDMTTNDSNVTVVGSLISKNTESATDVDATYGTVMYKHTSNATGLVFGNDYHNLIFNDGLVGYWPLDESLAGSTAADRSGYGHDATPIGSPAPSTDVAADIKFAYSHSLNFNGDDQYLSIPNNDELSPTSAITLSAWVKPQATNIAGAGIICKGSGSGGEVYCLDFPSANNRTPRFYFYSGGSSRDVTADSQMPADTWSHVAATYDGSVLKIYLNGEEAGTANFSGSLTQNTHEVTIGCRQSLNGGAYDRCLNGAIDDVRIYDRALSGSEIETMGSGETPAASQATTTLNHALNIGQSPAIGSGLIGYWAMDESTAGSDLADASGSGNTGTPVGSPQPSVDRPPQIAASQNPYSLSFDGNNYVNLGAPAGDITTGDFALSTWFKTSYTGGFQYLMSKRNGSIGYEIGIDSSSGNEGKIYIYLGDGNGPSVSWRVSTKDYRDGEWHHLAVTFDRDGSAQVYVDGSATGSPVNISAHQGSLHTSNPLVFGEYFAAHNQRLVGSMDDARIYDRVLSANDISQLYGGNLGLDGAGSLTINSGTLDVSASNYAINLAGDFENNGGVFVPRQGTVILNGGDQAINSSNTFYNLTKDISSGFTSPQTLTFGSGSTTTVSNDLTLTGASGAELALASSTSGKAWNINVANAASLTYLDVSDSTNTGGTFAPANSTDGGGNTNWNFGPPGAPSNLGGVNYVNGTFGTNTTPMLFFILSDPDAGTEVGYQLQIDDSSDFSSPVVDYTSSLASQGVRTFTVGQAAGSGSYTAGSAGQTLDSGNYYWRVKAFDIGDNESAFTTANSGSVAFRIDLTAPSVPGKPSLTTDNDDNTPGWTWDISTDAGIGLGSPAYTVEWSQESDFGTVTGSATAASNSFTHADELVDGLWYFRVKAVDDLGNESGWSEAGSAYINTTVFTGGSAISNETGTTSAITDLQITSSMDNPTVPVKLLVSHGSLEMTTTTGLSFFNASGDPLPNPQTGGTLYFKGSLDDVNTALATLQYTRNGGTGDDTLEASLVEPGEVFFPDNNHLYEYESLSLNWDDAKAAAESRSKYGARGYLATITSLDENNFIRQRLTADGWIGASDSDAEGSWRWVTGPEAGQQFWQGTAGGSIVNDMFVYWDNPTFNPGTMSSQPDEAGPGEDCGLIYSSGGGGGFWNDLTCSNTLGFVIEYGDLDGFAPAVSSKNIAITTEDTVPPGKPGTPTATTPTSDTTPTVSWSASNDDGSGLADPAYRLEWSGSATFDGGADGSLTTNSTSAEPNPALADGTWYFRVVAEDGAGNTSTSDISSGIVIDTSAPSTPGKPAVTTESSDNTPSWTWAASTDGVTGLGTPAYTVEWSQEPDFDPLTDSGTAASNSFTHSDELADGLWYLRVKAADAVGNESGWSMTGKVYVNTTLLTGSSSVTHEPGETTSITDLQIESGMDNPDVSVKLLVSHGTLSMTTTTGLSFFNENGTPLPNPQTGGTLYFSGALNDVNAALATLHYTRPSGMDEDTLEASLVEPGEVFFPGTGHLYEFIPGSINWNNARSAAEARSRYGAQGYLATITSAEENAFIQQRLTADGWIGANDAEVEGTWKWVTGPEAGTVFSVGNHTPLTQPGQYANWYGGEPNNALGVEDCGQFYSNGIGWNDLNCANNIPGYVVEYGGLDDVNPTVSSHEITITAEDNTPPTKPGMPSATTPTNNTTPTLSWGASSDPNGSGLASPAYTLEWSDSATFDSGPDGSVSTDDTSAAPGSSLADGTWYFRVRATDQAGNSAESDIASIQIDTGLPQITDLTATPGSNTGEVVIGWTTDDDTSSQVSYGPTVSLGTATPKTDTSPRVTDHSVTLSNLVPCSIYHFVVSSEDAAGNASTSSEQTFITSGCAGSADVVDHVTGTIDTASGGSLDLDTVSLTVPTGYAANGADFQIKQIDQNSAVGATGAPNGFKLASSKVYDIKALIDQENAVDSFNQPITITLSYTDPEIADLIESSLWIYRWNSGSGWQALEDCVVDEIADTVTCTTTAFSTFALYGTEKPKSPGQDSGGGRQTSSSSGGAAGSDGEVKLASAADSYPSDQEDPSDTDDQAAEQIGHDPAAQPAGPGAENRPASPASGSDFGKVFWQLVTPLAGIVFIFWLILAYRRRKDAEE